MTPEAGRRLKAYVQARHETETGWTSRLASELGISKTALLWWFAGRSEPAPDNLRKLARILGVTHAALVAAMDGE